MESRYISRACWAACTRSTKTKVNSNLLSIIWGVPLQEIHGRRIEASTEDFNDTQYNLQSRGEVVLTDGLDGCGPLFSDGPAWGIELSVIHSALIRQGITFTIRLTEGIVDGGCAETSSTRGGRVRRYGNNLRPWDYAPPLMSSPDGEYLLLYSRPLSDGK